MGVTDRGARGEPPPWQAKCKNRALFSWHFDSIREFVVFFCVFQGVFFFLSSMNIHNILIPPTVTSGPPSAKLCLPWLKPLATPQVMQHLTMKKFHLCFLQIPRWTLNASRYIWDVFWSAGKRCLYPHPQRVNISGKTTYVIAKVIYVA